VVVHVIREKRICNHGDSSSGDAIELARNDGIRGRSVSLPVRLTIVPPPNDATFIVDALRARLTSSVPYVGHFAGKLFCSG